MRSEHSLCKNAEPPKAVLGGVQSNEDLILTMVKKPNLENLGGVYAEIEIYNYCWVMSALHIKAGLHDCM